MMKSKEASARGVAVAEPWTICGREGIAERESRWKWGRDSRERESLEMGQKKVDLGGAKCRVRVANEATEDERVATGSFRFSRHQGAP